MNKPLFFLIALSLIVVAILVGQQPAVQAQGTAPDAKAVLGRALFFDTALSANSTQSCAACHGAEVGYTGPDHAVNAKGAVYPGALPNRFGNRKPPAAAYAGYSPTLHFVDGKGWFGGMFWDGRATGSHLADPLAEQAMGPFLNPLEQALPNAQVLCERVKKSNYAGLFDEAWGAGALDCSGPTQVQAVYENIGRSVAAFERSPEVNPFSSKFDTFWKAATAAGKDVSKINCGMGGPMMCGGKGMNPDRWTIYKPYGLTDNELIGLAMFNDPNRANCASCHALTTDPLAGHPLFTDYGYDNIGVPKNQDNPFYSMPKAWNPDGKNWIDYGLGGYLKSAGYDAVTYGSEMGKQKVPTLRNVDRRPTPDRVKAYGHNGYFKSLEEMVFFYHWRACRDSGMNCGGMGGAMGGGMGGDMGGGGMGGTCQQMMSRGDPMTLFPAPEVDENRAELSMFPCPQVDNIVAFLKTLSDGYQP